jgi:hypothetical protein
MKPKRTKAAAAAPQPLAEMSGNDKTVLTNAYKTGLIVGWSRDSERGYRLTLGDRRDEYVEIAKLTTYLDKLRKIAS